MEKSQYEPPIDPPDVEDNDEEEYCSSCGEIKSADDDKNECVCTELSIAEFELGEARCNAARLSGYLLAFELALRKLEKDPANLEFVLKALVSEFGMKRSAAYDVVEKATKRFLKAQENDSR